MAFGKEIRIVTLHLQDLFSKSCSSIVLVYLKFHNESFPLLVSNRDLAEGGNVATPKVQIARLQLRLTPE